jgi:hypothetical protein
MEEADVVGEKRVQEDPPYNFGRIRGFGKLGRGWRISAATRPDRSQGRFWAVGFSRVSRAEHTNSSESVKTPRKRL